MRRKRAKKCAEIICGDDDRISQLPDDILVHIISFLSLKEAVGTSVFSSRWLNLWKHSPCLNFDAHSSLERVAKQIELCSVKRPKYVKWVNCIIRKHKAATLTEFRIRFNLSKSATKVITQWLKFAFVRHVQRLELDFSKTYEDIIDRSRFHYCSFPEEFLTQNSGEASTWKLPSVSSGVDFKSLKVLALKCVDVTREAIEFFLRNCPLLEKLVVDGTYKLLNLEVCGPSLVLRHMELTHCHGLKSMKVSAPNLTSLVLERVEEFLLENVPKLVELSITYRSSEVLEMPPAFSCWFQLEILTLKLTHFPKEMDPSTFFELPKLKKLAVMISIVKGDQSLIGLTTLIRASPHLHEFVLELEWRSSSTLHRQVNNNIKFCHQHLKVFKLCGYQGHACDVELLRFIVENCVVLEKVIISPRYVAFYSRVPQNADEQARKDYVKQGLEAQVPDHIELLIS